MRAVQPRSLLHSVGLDPTRLGYWLDAGFSGIAYRLANLRFPRFSAVLAVSCMFYLV